MSRLASRYALLAVANVRLRALLAGLLLGALVHALAAQTQGGGFALAMAFVMVVSGGASFVLHALATAAAGGTAQARAARVRGWIVALGLGVVGGVQTLALIG